MSVSRNTPIVGQAEQVFASTCKTVTYGGASVSRVLANLSNLSSSEFPRTPRSISPTSGRSGHIRTFSFRPYGRKSLEKCSFDREKTAVRTQSGHFASGQLLGDLGVRASLKLYREAHDRAHHEAHDQAHDEAYDRAYDGPRRHRQDSLANPKN